jgi:hypothetical protein
MPLLSNSRLQVDSGHLQLVVSDKQHLPALLVRHQPPTLSEPSLLEECLEHLPPQVPGSDNLQVDSVNQPLLEEECSDKRNSLHRLGSDSPPLAVDSLVSPLRHSQIQEAAFSETPRLGSAPNQPNLLLLPTLSAPSARLNLQLLALAHRPADSVVPQPPTHSVSSLPLILDRHLVDLVRTSRPNSNRLLPEVACSEEVVSVSPSLQISYQC